MGEGRLAPLILMRTSVPVITMSIQDNCFKILTVISAVWPILYPLMHPLNNIGYSYSELTLAMTLGHSKDSCMFLLFQCCQGGLNKHDYGFVS